MKRFFIILCVLALLPITAFSAPSPTVKKMIHCVPEIPFEMAEDTEGWLDLFEWLFSVRSLTKGYSLLDAVYITLDKEYEKINWYLTLPVTTEHEPFVFIIDGTDLYKQEVSISEDGAVIVDFTDFTPQNYYLCFYVKDAE